MPPSSFSGSPLPGSSFSAFTGADEEAAARRLIVGLEAAVDACVVHHRRRVALAELASRRFAGPHAEAFAAAVDHESAATLALIDSLRAEAAEVRALVAEIEAGRAATGAVLW